MPTLADVERLCTALPSVSEGTTFRNRAWFVDKAVFCWVRPFTQADLRRLGDARVPQGDIVGLRTVTVAGYYVSHRMRNQATLQTNSQLI